VFVIILVFSVPWYFPAGSIYPIILGFPYWAAVCVVMSMVISGFLTYMMTNYWNMESLLEDGDVERRKAE
jgi:multidrug efflux pump subunit AcrB